MTEPNLYRINAGKRENGDYLLNMHPKWDVSTHDNLGELIGHIIRHSFITPQIIEGEPHLEDLPRREADIIKILRELFLQYWNRPGRWKRFISVKALEEFCVQEGDRLELQLKQGTISSSNGCLRDRTYVPSDEMVDKPGESVLGYFMGENGEDRVILRSGTDEDLDIQRSFVDVNCVYAYKR